MVSKEIIEKVYEFIKENPNRTKNHVVKKIGEYSRLTILAAIDELISKGRVRYSRDKPKGPYQLYINDINEFNVIDIEIDKLLSLADNLTKVVTKKTKFLNYIMTSFPNTPSFSIDLSNLVHLAQLVLYGRLTGASDRIHNNIKSTNDREVLYLRLVQVLNASNKLNKVIDPEIQKGVKETIRKMSLSDKSNKINMSNKSNRVKLDPQFEKEIPSLALAAMRSDSRYSTIQDIINAVRESF